MELKGIWMTLFSGVDSVINQMCVYDYVLDEYLFDIALNLVPRLTNNVNNVILNLFTDRNVGGLGGW